MAQMARMAQVAQRMQVTQMSQSSRTAIWCSKIEENKVNMGMNYSQNSVNTNWYNNHEKMARSGIGGVGGKSISSSFAFYSSGGGGGGSRLPADRMEQKLAVDAFIRETESRRSDGRPAYFVACLGQLSILGGIFLGVVVVLYRFLFAPRSTMRRSPFQ